MASEIKVDTISEKTSANGITIDGVNIKDSAIATAGSVPLTAIDIDGGTDIGAAIVDADLFIIDDGAGGTNRKVTASRIKTYAGGSDPSSADGDSLGTASLEWSDLYLADGGVVYFGNDQEITLTHSADSGLLLKHTATADDKPINLVLQTGETDMAADDVIGKISFQAPDEGTGTDAVLVSGAIQAVAEGDHSSSSNATRLEFMTGSSEAAATKMWLTSGGKLGLGTAPDLGTLHVRTADSSGGVSGDADELVLENSGHAGLTIASGNSSNGNIYFSDSGNSAIGYIQYGHDNNDLTIVTNDTGGTLIDSSGKIATGGETAPDVDAGGITIDHNANDANCFTLKNSDIAHGVTATAETDTYFKIGKGNSTLGGVEMTSFSEDIKALELGAMVGAVHTTKSTSGELAINARARLRDGTGSTDMSSNANLFGVSNRNTTVMIVDTEGEIHSDGGAQSAYDTYDDAQLVRAFDLSHGRGVIDSKFDKFVAYNHEKLAEMKLVGREEDGTPNHFVNVTGMQRLHNGAIWQQYEKHNQLLEAVYDLAKEAVGKEKANAILDKHEVKRLQ